MKTLVYFDGGDVYKGCHHRTKTEIAQIRAEAKEQGHVGYLIGWRYWDNCKDRVICFFKERPTRAEILQRRTNGFVGARWYPFRITPGYNRWDNESGGVIYIPPKIN